MDEAEFYRRFPRRYAVTAFDVMAAKRHGLPSDRTFWFFLEPFIFVSAVWGVIEIPQGFVTDFASVPPILRSLIDDDAPQLLFPSAPHDFLFAERGDGSRGWLPDGRQLTLREANAVLIEAMEVVGASAFDRANVLAAVEIANDPIRHTFRS